MEIRRAALTPELTEKLIALSGIWEREDSCYGYKKNGPEHIQGRTVYIAEESGDVIGYLFGIDEETDKDSSIMPKGTKCFEAEELYVLPEYRSKGVGRALFRLAETEAGARGIEFITLSAASKNSLAILRLYMDELGMSMWSARLFKKL